YKSIQKQQPEPEKRGFVWSYRGARTGSGGSSFFHYCQRESVGGTLYRFYYRADYFYFGRETRHDFRCHRRHCCSSSKSCYSAWSGISFCWGGTNGAYTNNYRTPEVGKIYSSGTSPGEVWIS